MSPKADAAIAPVGTARVVAGSAGTAGAIGATVGMAGAGAGAGTVGMAGAGTVGPAAGTIGTPDTSAGPLLSIGAAAARAGVTERSLRYYQELGLLVPSARTKGGMRRYSEADLDRVARIRELQTVVGLNLDEVADVLAGEGRLAELRAAYRSAGLTAGERRQVAEECLALALDLRQMVEAKRHAIEVFTADLDARIDRIKTAIAEAESLETVDAG